VAVAFDVVAKNQIVTQDRLTAQNLQALGLRRACLLYCCLQEEAMIPHLSSNVGDFKLGFRLSLS